MACPKCNSEKSTRNGIVHGRQRYRCQQCGYNTTVALKSNAFPAAVKEQALRLYLEGNGFRAIARLLGASHVSVYRWIRAQGEQTAALQPHKAIDVVEMDELHTYIGHKKTIAVRRAVGSG